MSVRWLSCLLGSAHSAVHAHGMQLVRSPRPLLFTLACLPCPDMPWPALARPPACSPPGERDRAHEDRRARGDGARQVGGAGTGGSTPKRMLPCLLGLSVLVLTACTAEGRRGAQALHASSPHACRWAPGDQSVFDLSASGVLPAAAANPVRRLRLRPLALLLSLLRRRLPSAAQPPAAPVIRRPCRRTRRRAWRG